MKALIFDVDDTLYDQLLPFKKAILQFVDLPQDSFSELYKQFRHYSDQLFEDSVSGKISMKEMQIYRMKMALADLGVKVSDKTAYAIQEIYSQEQEQLHLMAGVERLFEWCQKQGVELGIITNGPHIHQLKKIEALGLTKWIGSEKMIISGQVGVTKPNPAIFQLMEKRLGIPSSECCYVGDSFDNDVIGAKRANWKVVWFNHRHRPPGDKSIAADVVVESLQELVDHFQEKG